MGERAGGAYYLCPLSGVQMPAAELEVLLGPVWRGEQTLTPVYDPDTVGHKKPVVVAEGYETRVALTAEAGGRTVSWTDERILRAFRGLSLVVENVDGQIRRMLSPRSPLQKRLLRRLGLSADIYLRLVNHFLEPVPI